MPLTAAASERNEMDADATATREREYGRDCNAPEFTGANGHHCPT
jgi:hypothetical protein